MAEPSSPVVLVVAAEPGPFAKALKILRDAGYRVATALHEGLAEAVYNAPPQCLLMEYGRASTESADSLKLLKEDNIYGHLPVVLLLRPEDLQDGIDWAQIPCDDYLIQPFGEAELLSRVRLCLARAQRDVNANPLTGLPGNVTLMKEAERRIAAGEPFAMAYLDIDNFKAFNDKYGFSRGDEVLRMTARVIVNAIRSSDCRNAYIGHVGGDDFIFIIPSEFIPTVCKRIIADFDNIVPNFYDEDARRTGTISSVDRRGQVQTFPLMTVSIAVVDTQFTEIAHLADLSTHAAEVKHYAKQFTGSNYIVDRRK